MLRLRSYAHLQRLGLDYYEREMSGRIMTRMTTDVDALSTFLQTGLAQAVVAVLTFAGVAVALLLTDPGLALVALAMLPVLVVATVLFRRRSSDAYAEARERVSAVNADLQENVSGLRVSQAYVRERRSAEAFGERSLAYRQSRLRAQRYIATYFPFVALLSDLAQAAVLGVGAARVAAGTLTPGVLAAFLLYLDAVLRADLQQLSQVFDSYQQAKVGLLPDLRPAAHPDHRAAAAGGDRRPGARPAAPARWSCAGWASRYAGQRHRRAGRRVAAGRAGRDRRAGRARPARASRRWSSWSPGSTTRPAARCCVDGVDLRRYPLHELPSDGFGVVPQEPHLFTGDVASNIAYGRPDAGQTEIEAAARAVGRPGHDRQAARRVPARRSANAARGCPPASASWSRWPGPSWSTRTCCCSTRPPPRWTRRPRQAVLAAGDALAARRTTFVVAHRLTTAARADRIVVLDEGRIVEQGTHADLLAAGGRYAMLWRAGAPTADDLGRAPAPSH